MNIVDALNNLIQLLDTFLISNPVYTDFLDNEDTIWGKV